MPVKPHCSDVMHDVKNHGFTHNQTTKNTMSAFVSTAADGT